MRYALFILLMAILISCNQNQEIDQNPTTIEGKRKLLNQKKDQLDQLEAEIAELTQDLVKNDPSLEKKKKIVTTIPVTTSSFTKFINLEGVVIADKTANAVSETPGRITQLYVKEGDYVNKGATIATLDMESVNTQKNDILNNLELARDIYNRRSKLWAQNIGSEIQYLEAKNNVERLEKSLELINVQLSKGKVYAPISGVIDMEFLEQGELASPGMPIVQILNTRDVKVQVDLPERYLSILKRGLKVNVFFPSLDLTQSGKVSLIGRSIDPANRTLKFEVDVPNRNGMLKPNLLAELQLIEKNIDDVITVPLEIIQQDVNNNSFVMMADNVDGEQKAIKKEVAVADVYEGIAMIEDGLSSGDVLINDGARLVSNMEGIEIINDKSE